MPIRELKHFDPKGPVDSLLRHLWRHKKRREEKTDVRRRVPSSSRPRVLLAPVETTNSAERGDGSRNACKSRHLRMPAVARGWRRCEEEKSRDPSQNRKKSRKEQDPNGANRVRSRQRVRIVQQPDHAMEASGRRQRHTSDARGWIVASNPANAPRSTSARQSHFFLFLCMSSVPCGEQKSASAERASNVFRGRETSRGEDWKLH
ncbi:hypothetical protein J3F84DRAFT_148588 [Trichoderma pleuroticola]